MLLILAACQGDEDERVIEIPAPTLIPLPTYTPYPTLDLLPTYTPYPTHTPYPTPNVAPTYTPYPTLVPIVETHEVYINWQKFIAGEGTGSGIVGHETDGQVISLWVLMFECYSEEPYVFLTPAFYNIYSEVSEDEDGFEEQLLLRVDNDVMESTWWYWPAEDYSSDYFSAEWPSFVYEILMDAERLVIEIPSGEGPYQVAFNVTGLSRQLPDLEAVCSDK